VTLPGPLAFANSQTGTAAPVLTLVATNNGLAAETISSIAVTGVNATDFVQTNTCTTVAVNGTCTLALTFTPTTAAAESGTVTLTTSAGTQFAINLTGTGVAPTATLSAATAVSAQNGSAAAPFTLTLTNTGIGPEVIGSIGVSGTNAADFVQTNTCPVQPAALAPNGTCVITVTFTATIVGAETASLAVTDTAGTQSVTLSGTGVAPSAAATPAALTFAATAAGTSSATQTFTLSNTGIGPIGVNPAAQTVLGGVAGDFLVASGCPGTLGVGGSCLVSVTFTPTAGELSASVDSQSVTVGGTVPVTVTVSGTVQ